MSKMDANELFMQNRHW